MANNRAFDSLEQPDMAWPYAPNAGPLINKPFFTAGLNSYVSWGGTLRKRPALIAAGVAAVSGVYPERLWVYETLEASPVVYLVGSFRNGSVYELRYSLVSSLGSWTPVTERRGCQRSRWPHEGCVRRGFLFIKSFPAAGIDPDNLGSVYLDGTGAVMATHDWGALGPQVPTALTNPGGWSASAHAVTVLNGWLYTYTWQKVSGQETNQAPLQTNPDANPSDTGPFSNLIPHMTVQGHPDTAEYPLINIYRTTDGGGSFFYVYQIPNTGAGSIVFDDKYLASGSGNADPQPDVLLNTQHQAPSSTSNSPPPSVAPPLVTGIDAIQRSTPIIEYASRLWYCIQEYIFYSADEELDEGVPEESFPSGLAVPNFFRARQAIMNLVSTPDGPLFMSRRDTTRISGTTKSTFNPRPFLGNVGAASQQPRAITQASEYSAWLTQDYRIAIAHGDAFAVLSNPLGDTIKTAAAAGAQIELLFWTEGDKEWLVCCCHRLDDTTLSQWFCYDLDRARRQQDDFWFCPWSVRSTAVAAGAISASNTNNLLFAALWDGVNFRLAQLDAGWTIGADVNPTSGAAAPFGWTTRTSLLAVPLGDHVNALRRPDFSPVAASFQYERTVFAGDGDAAVQAYYDDLYTDPVTLPPATPPPRRRQSKGYKTCIHTGLQRVAKRVAVQWTGQSNALLAEVQQCSFGWLPESGA